MLLLVVLPVWLVVSAGFGIWFYLKHERKIESIEQARFAQAVSVPLLEDDLKKIVEVIGERNASSETAASNLSRMASMVDGLLGPSNTGYPVKRIKTTTQWPILQVTLKGKNEDSPALWVVTSYDSPIGSRGSEANATGLAATIAAAQALAHEKPVAPIHFVFIPHANDLESPVIETATKLRETVLSGEKPHAVLCVEAMGGGEELWLTSRDTTAFPLTKATGLGKVVGAEVACLGEDTDLASVLFEMGLPAVRVATRAILPSEEADNRLPFTPTVASSTGRLIELIRRCQFK